ncbi:hypothetical protein DMENIID0001_134160 [Sergentomyia squamirostris]
MVPAVFIRDREARKSAEKRKKVLPASKSVPEFKVPIAKVQEKPSFAPKKLQEFDFLSTCSSTSPPPAKKLKLSGYSIPRLSSGSLSEAAPAKKSVSSVFKPTSKVVHVISNPSNASQQEISIEDKKVDEYINWILKEMHELRKVRLVTPINDLHHPKQLPPHVSGRQQRENPGLKIIVPDLEGSIAVKNSLYENWSRTIPQFMRQPSKRMLNALCR